MFTVEGTFLFLFFEVPIMSESITGYLNFYFEIVKGNVCPMFSIMTTCVLSHFRWFWVTASKLKRISTSQK